MKINKAIPCYYVCHRLCYGDWKIEPAFVEDESKLNVVNCSNTELISVYIDEVSPVDAVIKAYRLITRGYIE